MSHVNTTPHYGLPIYGENDIINPLTDFNDANSAIDTALYEIADAQGSEASAISDINTFLGDKELETVAQNVTDAVNEVNTAVGNADTAIGNVAGDVVTLQTAVGDANTGLIHDVGALQTTVGSQGNSITAIQLDVGALQGSMVTAKADISDIKLALQSVETTVGDATSGLVKDVDDLEARVDASTFGNIIDIASAMASADGYTAPSDGYVFVTCQSTSGVYIKYSINGAIHTVIGGSGFYPSDLMPVKKGMVIKTGTTDYTAPVVYGFYPLS